MRFFVIPIMFIIASPALADVGDLALQAVAKGLTQEMAQTACDEGDQTACIMVNQSIQHPTEVTTLLVQVIIDGQATCARNPGSDDCDQLKTMDRQAKEVLAKHGILQPEP